MEFLPEKIDDYVARYTQGENEVLADLNRSTWSKVLQPRMLSGHVQGRILSTFSHMLRPERVLEIGTYTGYSAICMAEGLAEDGKLITIDINEELEDMVHDYVARSGFENKIELVIGNAVDVIPKREEEWDLVFIDADKENYATYFDLVIDRVRPGGFIIADNVLWSGKVIQEPEPSDKETQGVLQFNEKVHSDSRVENVLFPVRDGLMVCRKLL